MEDPIAPESLKNALDRCVKCGLCLAECPTYRLTADENESPRGRLALIEAIVDGQLSADTTMRAHLDTCLVCRRCERTCPSGVPYGTIIDTARAITRPEGRHTWRNLLRNPRVQALGTSLARHVPLGASQPFPGLHRLHRLAGALPQAVAAPAPGHYPAEHRPRRGHVGLFTGCATRAQQGSALLATLAVLRRIGFDVTVPTMVCCGAMHAHAGDLERAAAHATACRETFPGGLDAIVSIASGCGVHVDSYREPLPAPHRDICAFLVETGTLQPDMFEPLRETVALHVPCTVENVYRGGSWARQLVERLQPQALHTLQSPGQCCGAAGEYLLRHPETAAALRAPLIAQIEQHRPRYLLTSNIGCAMHLANGLSNVVHDCRVLHPVELLASRLTAQQASNDQAPAMAATEDGSKRLD